MPVYGMREHIVEGVHILEVCTKITLLLTWRWQSWHKGYCTASAHHHILWQTDQCECHPVRGAQAVATSLRDCPLTWRRNTQIQMYCLWKWLESYSNCTSPDGPSLIFYHSDFWTTFLLCKTALPWNFSRCWNIFYLSGLLSNLWLALKNRVCPEFIVLNIYIFNNSDFWTTCACPEK